MEAKRLSAPGYVPFTESDSSSGSGSGSACVHDVIIVHQNPLKKYDVAKQHDKPNDYTELAILACFFNFIFALVAMSLSFKSSENWEAGKRRAAKTYGLLSMFISVLAIISTAVVVFICVWFFVPRHYQM